MRSSKPNGTWSPVLIEANVEEAVIAIAEGNGWFVRKIAWIGRRSAPDRFFAKNGRIIFVEFKRPKKDASAAQAREHERMRRYGIEVYVVNSIEDGRALFS